MGTWKGRAGSGAVVGFCPGSSWQRKQFPLFFLSVGRTCIGGWEERGEKGGGMGMGGGGWEGGGGDMDVMGGWVCDGDMVNVLFCV